MKFFHFLILLLVSADAFSQKSLKNLPSQPAMEKMTIEIWSDIACPFCYIGKRHMEKALENFENKGEVEIVWKSFQLDPDLVPENGKNLYETLAEKKGWSINQTKQITQNVVQLGTAAGLNFNFDNAIPANTFKAHCILQYAKLFGKGHEMKEVLFNAYFVEGKNIADEQLLLQLASSIGLKDADVSVFSDKDLQQKIESDIYESRQVGVQGVPFFVVNNRYGISGAQPVSVFSNTLTKAYQEWQKSKPANINMAAEGNVCVPDEGCK